MEVFIVTVGVYSDYTIMCVCSSRKIAEHYIKDVGYGEDAEGCQRARVEVYDLDCPRNEGFHLYDVEIDISTRKVELELHTSSEITDHNDISWSNDKPRLADKVSTDFSFNGTSLVWDYMRAKSKEHSAKIANEKVSAMIASGSLIPVPGKDGFWQWREKESG